MKALLVIALGALALALPAQAAPNPCKDWANAQSGSGAAFSSKKECQKAAEVFTPSLTINPQAAPAGAAIRLSAAGFHGLSSVTLSIAVTGQPPYVSHSLPPTNPNGTFSQDIMFFQCGDSHDLTITLIDSFGVHASASLVLC